MADEECLVRNMCVHGHGHGHVHVRVYVRPVTELSIPFVVLGRRKLGTGEIWNGKIRHYRSVPNYAMVFEGPKPFFQVSFSALSACTFPLCPIASRK